MPRKKKTTKTANLDDIPSVLANEVTIVVSKEDLLSMIQLLAFSRDVFANMALTLLQDGNEADSKTISARSILAGTICSKLKDIAVVGEPESRQVH